MKLSTMQVQHVLDQFENDTTVIPESHPKAEEFKDIFGAHTFFLDKDGLEIIEPVVAKEVQQVPEEVAQVVRVAMWKDAERTTLKVSQAKTTGVVVVFPTET